MKRRKIGHRESRYRASRSYRRWLGNRELTIVKLDVFLHTTLGGFGPEPDKGHSRGAWGRNELRILDRLIRSYASQGQRIPTGELKRLADAFGRSYGTMAVTASNRRKLMGFPRQGVRKWTKEELEKINSVIVEYIDLGKTVPDNVKQELSKDFDRSFHAICQAMVTQRKKLKENKE